jgi:hypothetical protein
MADKKVTTVTQASGKEVQAALNNCIALVLGSEDGPPESRMRRLAQYTREFYRPMRAVLLEEELLRPSEAVVILLSCALLTHQSTLVAEERKVPATMLLDVLFNKEEE